MPFSPGLSSVSLLPPPPARGIGILDTLYTYDEEGPLMEIGIYMEKEVPGADT